MPTHRETEEEREIRRMEAVQDQEFWAVQQARDRTQKLEIEQLRNDRLLQLADGKNRRIVQQEEARAEAAKVKYQAQARYHALGAWSPSKALAVVGVVLLTLCRREVPTVLYDFLRR